MFTLHTLAAITFTVTDLDATAEAYAEGLGYRVVERDKLDAALAASWHAPAAAGSRMLVMENEGPQKVPLRFVERPATPGYTPLHHHGWNAAEIVVANVDALYEHLGSVKGFTRLRPPADLSITDTIRACQVAGPSGEIIYLTEVKSVLPIWELPQATAACEHSFIVISAGPDIEASRSFYADKAGLKPGNVSQSVISVLSQALNLPLETTYPLAVAALQEKTMIELDELPASCTARPLREGDLPPGQAIVSFRAALDSDSTMKLVKGQGLLYRQARATTVRGAAGELIELLLPA